ncbi:hypothetical protein [Streptomyces apocyni]|uniref:hypothetical protein n=1 Tax=Streptomyces apocyni TaxID=2654677 RepID=UPI0012E9B72A|nr:hypothetical protein [Streptomyces apocyni]
MIAQGLVGVDLKLVALVDHARDFRSLRTGGTLTLSGRSPLSDLAVDPAIGAFYHPHVAEHPNGLVSFVLTVDSRDLPMVLETEVPATSEVDGVTRDAPHEKFSVSYRDWAKGDPIAVRPGPSPSPPWTS